MSRLSDNQLLIGVDGGATEVKVHQVLVLEPGARPELAAGPATTSTCYEVLEGFEPLPIAQQLEERDSGRCVPSDIEVLQGELWVEAAAGAILSVAAQAGARDILLGVCMPGLKTSDGRGISVSRHGPRIPDYCRELERELTSEGLRLIRPVGALASDGEACAWGEECDVQGLLRSTENAYYVGGGTGIAEALKLSGAISSFDAVRTWMPKAWEMRSALGGGVEDLLSMRGINERHARRVGVALPLSNEDLPEVRAQSGDERAIHVFLEAAEVLAELCMARMRTLHGGKVVVGGSTATGRSVLLDRIVIGQHLGRLFELEGLGPRLLEHVEASLRRLVEETESNALRSHYLEGCGIRDRLLTPSTLRAAPAIGAAALAWMGARSSAPFAAPKR